VGKVFSGFLRQQQGSLGLDATMHQEIPGCLPSIPTWPPPRTFPGDIESSLDLSDVGVGPDFDPGMEIMSVIAATASHAIGFGVVVPIGLHDAHGGLFT
jgi:hypothetical protein